MNPSETMTGSGMKRSEARTKASVWWNEYRGVIRRTFNLTQQAPSVRSAIAAKSGSMVAPAFVIKGETKEEVQDGILSGRPWAGLTLKEQHTITDVWHHNHVMVPLQQAVQRDMRRAGVGSLYGSEKAETPHDGKPESKPNGQMFGKDSEL